MTAATVHQNLRAAVRANLLEVSGLPKAAWEGIAFNDNGEPFIRESFRPIASTLVSIGSGSTIRHRIDVLLTLFYPSGDGTVAIEAMASALLSKFSPQTRLSYGGDEGMVMGAERRPILTEPDWLSLTVTISIHAYTTS